MKKVTAKLDHGFFIAVIVLTLFGLLMQFSASISISEHKVGTPFFYFQRQSLFLFVALLLSGFIYFYVSMKVIERMAIPFLLFGLTLLVLVLIPGVGEKINGSYRWLSLGSFNVQPSEVAKLFIIVYLARFFSGVHGDACEMSSSDYLMPILILACTLILLLLEPDFGSTLVVATTAVGLLFVSGFSLKKFFVIGLGLSVAALLLIISSPYRMRRLTSFSDPWSDPFDSGFQLSQALIAFGRGEVSGVGLGASIQKYAYLPEAHTDFIFAVVGEELGVIGVIFLIALTLFISLKTIKIGRKILTHSQSYFSGYLVVAIGFWFGLQTSINMGVNLGVLPTKGITFPLLSYGGSSLVISCMAFAFVFRANYELNSGVKYKNKSDKGLSSVSNYKRGNLYA